MKTTIAKSPLRSPSYTKFATPLVLDPPRHCGMATILLGWGKHLLGTARDCAVRVRAEGVEPHHAMIVVSEHRTVLKALDPRTWVNEGPVSEMALRPGDRLSLGPLTFRVRAADADELAAMTAANEQTFDDDTHGIVAIAEPPAKRTFSVDAIPKTPRAVPVTPVPRVVDSVSSEFAGPESASPLEPRKVAEDPVMTSPAPSSHDVPRSSAVTRPVAPSNVPTAKPTDGVHTPPEPSSPTATLDHRLEEIEQKLAELQRPVTTRATATADVAARTEVTVEADTAATARHQLIAGRDELQQRADELARQLQQFHERVARVAEREAEVEQSRARLAREYEQLGTTAEVTRQQLDDEYARHRTLWQEWDAASHRTSGELNGQLQSMEQRRTALQAEADRLSAERSELQRLQAEHERERRVHAAERVQLTTDSAALQSLRAEFDTERQQHLVAIQEREARVAAERRMLSVTQEELLGTRQQLERDRSEFLAARSTEALRRERELREHVGRRERLDQDHARIQDQQREVEERRRAVEEERMAFASEREAFDSQLVFVAADRTELARVRERLQQAEVRLAEWSTRREVEPSVPVAVASSEATANSAAGTPSVSPDWLLEPYRNIYTPPPIPAAPHHESSFDESSFDESSFDGHAAGEAIVAPGPVDVLPLTRAVPAACDIPQPTASPGDESPRTDIGTGIAPRVTAPAASHRFWEDDTLYDTSVSAQSPHPGPSAFVASSNLMIDATSATPTVTMSQEVASLYERARFATGTSFDESPEDSSVAMWSRSLSAAAPDAVSQLQTETVGSTATATANDVLTVDETLAVINRRFGIPLPTDAVSSTAAAGLPAWWGAGDTAAVTAVPDHRTEDDVSEEVASGLLLQIVERDERPSPSGFDPSASEPTGSADSLSSLRAQLAQLFDLPAHVTDALDETTEPGTVSANQESAEDDSPAADDGLTLTLAPTGHEAASESPPQIDSNQKSGIGPTSHSDHATADSSGSVPQTDTATPAATAAAESESEAEDSIETCMAKLLSRTRGTEVSAHEVKSFTTSSASATSREPDPSDGTLPVDSTPFDPADRSHLTAEPKHKQDRQAARDDLHSFRQVAHLSARSALARHTTKNLLSSVIAKSMLLGVSALATGAFLGAPLVGLPTQFWKAGACSVALLLSAIEVYRSWRQFRRWKTTGEPPRKNNPKPAASSTPESATAAPESKPESLPADATVE